MKNYHTHTSRCHHAMGTDEDYVKVAIEEGYTTLGFADHACWHYTSSFRPHIRMLESEFDLYQESIQRLKETYQDRIEILCGMEAEYFPSYMDWMRDFCIEKNIDYLLFGNHYYESDETGVYYGNCHSDFVQNYFDSTVQGLHTGLYACLAHPELILLNRFPKWNDQLEEGFHRICQEAKKMDIPLEYNVLGKQKAKQMGFVAYPHPRFWQIASQYHNKAIIGMDAHHPLALDRDLFMEALDELSKFDVEIVDTIKKVDFKALKQASS